MNFQFFNIDNILSPLNLYVRFDFKAVNSTLQSVCSQSWALSQVKKYLLDRQLSKLAKLNIESNYQILSHVHKKPIESPAGAQSVFNGRGFDVVYEWQRPKHGYVDPYTEPRYSYEFYDSLEDY